MSAPGALDSDSNQSLNSLIIQNLLTPTRIGKLLKYLPMLPGYTVLHNHHLVGRKSQTRRQIDIAVMWENAGQETLLKIVTCRTKTRKLELQTIADAIEMKGDLRPLRMEFCSSSGFSQSAVKRLTAEGIQCRTVS